MSKHFICTENAVWVLDCWVLLSHFFFFLFAHVSYFGASCQKIAPHVWGAQLNRNVNVEGRKCSKYAFTRIDVFTQTSPRWISSAFVLLASKNCSLASRVACYVSTARSFVKKNNSAGIAPYICWVLHSWCGSRRSPRLTTNSLGALLAVLTGLYINRASVFVSVCNVSLLCDKLSLCVLYNNLSCTCKVVKVCWQVPYLNRASESAAFVLIWKPKWKRTTT